MLAAESTPEIKERAAMELRIEIRAKPEKFQELYQTLQALVPLIRKAKGCLDCRISRNDADAEIFFLSTRWEHRTDLENYLNSLIGGALVGAIELLGENVKIGLGKTKPQEGIDALKKMRKSGLQ